MCLMHLQALCHIEYSKTQHSLAIADQMQSPDTWYRLSAHIAAFHFYLPTKGCTQLQPAREACSDKGKCCSPGLQLLPTLRHLQTACSFRHLNHPLISSKDGLYDILWSDSVSDVSHLFQPSAWCMQPCAAATPGWKARRAMRL